MADTRPKPLFVADAPGLDFLNTITATTGASMEVIADGRDLLHWLESIGVVPPEKAQELAESAILGELDSVAAQARDLREWFRGFVLAHKGRSLDATALGGLEPLNRLLARDEIYGSVGVAVGSDHPDGDGHDHEQGALAWRWHRRWTTPESLLQPIARAMADVVCNADFVHVKQCEGLGCRVLFHDITRGRARRWCSMAICGNRTKQAAHRARQRDGTKARTGSEPQ